MAALAVRHLVAIPIPQALRGMRVPLTAQGVPVQVVALAAPTLILQLMVLLPVVAVGVAVLTLVV
jgi:hypothetical protein